MYCINCGVRLADTERKCPLCGTTVYHPDLKQKDVQPLYPVNKLPEHYAGEKALSGAILILFFIPLMITFFADWQTNGILEWFGYVAGALGVIYVIFALPMWFQKKEPVFLTCCGFGAVAAYTLYICMKTGGDWFLTFALPMLAGFCILTCVTIALFRYVKKGALFILGGGFFALGGLTVLSEYLLDVTFQIAFIGWSVYPFIVLFIFGGLLIYFGINGAAREFMKRKLFF